MTTPNRLAVVRSVTKRDFLAYFVNPTGYVFITVFILLGAIAAFWSRSFFMNNLADLDALNRLFPLLLLFFVPALTMNTWSEERRRGTDELLLTLPARDVDVVLGKYLAALGIYSVAVLLSLSHLVILAWLGEPDLGLMLATYLGYWLAGGALLAVGMVASLLTVNATVAFILGALLCGAFVFADVLESALGERSAEWVRGLGLVPHFRRFGEGLVPLDAVLYFALLAGVMLYANVAILRRRHAGGSEGTAGAVHGSLRAIALAAAAIAICVLAGRSGAAIDATAERLHTLHPETARLIDAIPDDRPVVVQAFVSPSVPESLVATRKTLLALLDRMDRIGGDRLRLRVHETEPFTEVAADARNDFGIEPRQVVSVDGGRRATQEVYLGVVFASGPDEFVIPFLDRGLPVEYELARSVRVVCRAERRRVGVLVTDAQPFGGFDFETMASRADWSFVAELRKQYDVERIAPEGPYPADLDALVAILPSSLTAPQLATLEAAVRDGLPTLLVDDSLPIFNPNLSPSLPKDAGRNPFTSQGQPPVEPKGDLRGMLSRLGVALRNDVVVWSESNPHPALADVEKEIVFVAAAPDNPHPFDERSPITSGLQEVVALFPGAVERSPLPGGELEFAPLLTTGTASGDTPWDGLVRRDFIFGIQLVPNPRRFRTESGYVLAARVRGTPPPGPVARDPGAGAAPAIDLVVVADCDLVSETFFNLRRQGFEDLNFDNVTFALNCIDALAGDESFVALRKHRPRHRTLTRVEERSRVFLEARRAEVEAAEGEAATRLDEARERLESRVAALRDRTDLDEQTRAIMLRSLESVESRRLDVVEATITQEKDRRVAQAKTEMNVGIAGIQRRIKWMAALIPPIPTLLLAFAMFTARARRERAAIAELANDGARP